MRVDSIDVQNIRGFADHAFAFPTDFTLLVGENGSGKSSLIDSIAAGLAEYTTGLEREVPESWIRLRRHGVSQTVRFEQQLPASIHVVINHEGTRYHGECLDHKSDPSDDCRVRAQHLSNELFGKARRNEVVTLPVIAAYGAYRLTEEKSPGHAEHRSKAQLSRLDGYRESLGGKLLLSDIFGWLRDEQFASLQDGEDSVLFRAVTEAMCACLYGARKVEYNVRQHDVIVEFQSGEVLSYANLSDGQRIMLSLVADIAYRAAWMNPHLTESVLQETDGIVLIDEIDLHLHPKWQRLVVDDLKRTFPRIQFIATSHSPFIIQSLEPSELIVLDAEAPIEYANRGVEEIARFIQGVESPHTSQRYAMQKAAAKRYFTLLREGRSADDPELIEAKRELDGLTSHFSDNPAADAFLEMQRMASDGSSAE